jgi:hypothetical protein
METYKGAIVEESLLDNRILNEFKILALTITPEDDPAERWHIFDVEASKDQLLKLSKNIKPMKWYAHFWDKDKNIIAVFKDKTFVFNWNDKTSWQPAIKYGLSVEIPIEQLDFLIH